MTVAAPRTPAAPDQSVLATLKGGERVWAVAAIHGEARRLKLLHSRLARLIQPCDQLIYLGGYLGLGPAVIETIDELLLFRRAFIARPDVPLDSIIFLRGAQEEMWQKLLQLQFAAAPAEVLSWMVAHGIGPTIAAYGGSVEEGLSAAAEGVVALTRWTSSLRQGMQRFDGHIQLMSSLKHYATTDDNALLFVHAGIDPARPLETQRDLYWWGATSFETLAQPYGGFRLVVRGHSPHGEPGLNVGEPVVTLDAGCGKGGPLIAACFDAGGDVVQLVEG